MKLYWKVNDDDYLVHYAFTCIWMAHDFQLLLMMMIPWLNLAPTAAAQKSEDLPLTYLNKGGNNNHISDCI